MLARKCVPRYLPLQFFIFLHCRIHFFKCFTNRFTHWHFVRWNLTFFFDCYSWRTIKIFFIKSLVDGFGEDNQGYSANGNFIFYWYNHKICRMINSTSIICQRLSLGLVHVVGRRANMKCWVRSKQKTYGELNFIPLWEWTWHSQHISTMPTSIMLACIHVEMCCECHKKFCPHIFYSCTYFPVKSDKV